MKRVCVFCGASPGHTPTYLNSAVAMARALADRGCGIVYGGGNVGLMGALADEGLRLGIEVIGVIPERLMAREVGHQGLTKLHVVHSMHERKALMAELADAFVALPGGFGTLEEFCEILTWGQLGLHNKPCGLLNVDHFYDPLIAMFDHSLKEGLLKPEYRKLVVQSDTPDQLMDRLEHYQAQGFRQILDESET